MAINEAEFKKRKKAADEARRTRDRAAGQLDAAMARLHDEFECETIEAAEALSGRLERKAAKAEKAYNTAVAEFEEEWGEQLDED